MEDIISVVVPIYKVEKYLAQCIESIIRQTYQNLDILLIDDGSPDNCGEICESYAQKDGRITVFHKKNGGLSDARNYGIKQAKGKYICFIDSDDCIDKQYIEILYHMCKENNCKIAQCDYLKFWDKDEPSLPKEEVVQKKISVDEMLEGLYTNHHIQNIIACNKLYDISLFQDILYTVGKIHEDEFTTYKLFLKCDYIMCINQKLYFYRQREDSITGVKFSYKRLDYLKALKERMEIFQKENKEQLYALTLKCYCYILLQFYNKGKKYLPDKKKLRKVLLHQYKKLIHIVLKQKYIKMKSKIIMVFLYFFPELYPFLFKKKI